MAENNAVVRVYDPHAEAEATIKELYRSGFDMNKLSIVGKDYHIAGHVIGYYNAGDRMSGSRGDTIMIQQTPQADEFKQQLRDSLQRETLNTRAVKIARHANGYTLAT